MVEKTADWSSFGWVLWILYPLDLSAAGSFGLWILHSLGLLVPAPQDSVRKGSMRKLIPRMFRRSAPREQPVVYVALGDSLAAGIPPIVPGYPVFYANWLRSPDGSFPGRKVKLVNVARYGWTSRDLAQALHHNRRYQGAVKSAHVITLDTGGNDLLFCPRNVESLERALKDFKSNLETLLTQVRWLNQSTRLYIMDLYNPFFGCEDDETHVLASTYVPMLNGIIHDTAKNPVLGVSGVACVYDRFLGYEKEFTLMNSMFRDIHPNHRGQRVIASCFVCCSKVYELRLLAETRECPADGLHP